MMINNGEKEGKKGLFLAFSGFPFNKQILHPSDNQRDTKRAEMAEFSTKSASAREEMLNRTPPPPSFIGKIGAGQLPSLHNYPENRPWRYDFERNYYNYQKFIPEIIDSNFWT